MSPVQTVTYVPGPDPEAVQAVLDVVAEVQERYASVQALDQRLAVLRDRQTLVNRLLGLARSRLRAGEAGRLDVITLDAERAALEADLIERLGELRDQRLALARLVERPSGEAAWSVPPWEPADAPVADERAWVEAALRHRPEAQAQRWELAAPGDEAAIAGWGIFDGASAGASAQRDPGWAVGPSASVPVPLFNWGQARRDRAEALRVAGHWTLLRDALQWNANWDAPPVFYKDGNRVLVVLQRGGNQICISENSGTGHGGDVLLGDDGVPVLVSSSPPPSQEHPRMDAFCEISAGWSGEPPLLFHDHDGYLMVLLDDFNEVVERSMAQAEAIWTQHGGKRVYFYSFSPELSGTPAPLCPERFPRKAMELVAMMYPDDLASDESGSHYPEYSVDRGAPTNEPKA